MPVYSSTGQIIHPSDPNYAIYAAQNNPPPGGIPPTSPPSTPANAYGNLLYETPEERAYRLEQERLGEEARLRGQTNVDENSIRTNVTNRFQAEIDALNRIYAEKKKRAMVEGEGRLGSDAAIQARRGLIGSTFGGAQTGKVNEFNNEIIGGIDSELQAMLTQIHSKIKSDVASELAAKTEAKRAGATEYLEFLKGAAERKKERVNNAVKNMLLGNLNPDDAMFKGIAEQLGVSVETLKAQYNEIKSASDAAAEEKQLATDKTKSEIAKNYGSIELDLLKNTLDSDKFSWTQKQDLIKNELEKSKLKADQTKSDRDYQLQLQKYLLDVENSRREKGEIVKINGVDYEKQPDGTYDLPKTRTPKVSNDEKKKKADDIIAAIDLIYSDKNLSNAIGSKSSQTPQWLRTGKRNAVDGLIDSLVTNLAIDNLGILKGPMSDKDIEFIKQASTNGLRKDTDLKTFKKRLDEIKTRFDTIKVKIEKEKQIRTENPELTDDEIYQIINGESFNGVGSDTKKATSMRTDRHNNPAAFTVDIAKQAGLVLGKDYTVGDPFPNNPNLKTARLIGDPVAQTIKVIDRIGLYTQSGQPRWTYVNSIPGANNWKQLSNSQKVAFIKQMYSHEGGTALRDNFKIYA